MTVDTLIFKIGGKIIEDKSHLENIFAQLKDLNNIDNAINKIIIIPGGGSKVDVLRKSFDRGEIDNEQAHWEAIKIMDDNADSILDRYPECVLFSELSDLKKSVESEEKFNVIIFKVYDFLKENDDLPHNWNVTSDSIAFSIANKLNLSNCYFVKVIDGIYAGSGKTLIKELTLVEYLELKAKNLLFEPIFEKKDSNLSDLKKKNRPIDSYLIHLITEYDINCIILNGISGSSRIVEYFQLGSERERVYTKIHQ